jgi:hypothetical protein
MSERKTWRVSDWPKMSALIEGLCLHFKSVRIIMEDSMPVIVRIKVGVEYDDGTFSETYCNEFLANLEVPEKIISLLKTQLTNQRHHTWQPWYPR